MTTKIEWATHTSNWLAGCTKVSPACTNCYAETMTRRMASGLSDAPRYNAGVIDTDTGRWTGRLAYDRPALMRAFDELIRARKPRRVFVNSMSDTFHDDAPRESLIDLATRIDEIVHGLLDGTCTRWPHVLMLLTKRPENLLRWQREHFPDGLPPWVWVGCTVEDQRRADERVPVLLRVQAAVRFLSYEPALGPVRMHWSWFGTSLDGYERSIAWVIAGGESGRNARPSHPDWYLVIRDQCVAAGVPFFFKQWGEWALWHEDGRLGDIVGKPAGFFDYCERWNGPPDWPDAGVNPFRVSMVRVGKQAAGRELDGRTWDELPDTTSPTAG